MHHRTKATTILQFIQGLRGDLRVTLEEGTWAAWMYDCYVCTCPVWGVQVYLKISAFPFGDLRQKELRFPQHIAIRSATEQRAAASRVGLGAFDTARSPLRSWWRYKRHASSGEAAK
jgi:hypothetical protein